MDSKAKLFHQRKGVLIVHENSEADDGDPRIIQVTVSLVIQQKLQAI